MKMQEKENTTISREKGKKKREITIKANRKGRHVMWLMNVLRVIVIPIYWLFKP